MSVPEARGPNHDAPLEWRAPSPESSARREALTDAGVLRRFLGNPTMTLAVIVRIHWQALHLLCKRARFHRKPAPPAELVTR
jgi:DUF1365 family protein